MGYFIEESKSNLGPNKEVKRSALFLFHCCEMEMWIIPDRKTDVGNITPEQKELKV